jgi:glutamate--cysteine ligase
MSGSNICGDNINTGINANTFQENLSALINSEGAQALKDIRRGLEKESLRVTPNGRLSQTSHPTSLGSTLTHPNITTDYSESLLELITEPHKSIDDLLQQLSDTHSFIYQNIGQELLWVNSMPCIVGDDLSIPIAQYGSSNIGKMKTVYRHGLWHRYGRLMQAIAGIHFNFSLPEAFWKDYQAQQNNTDDLQTFISAQYFKLIRNFQRYAWLPVYLFGASPAVCASFVNNREHGLTPMAGETNTYHLKNATSLRMSDLGYQNDAQADLIICYNSVDSYTKSLEKAIKTPHAPYQKIGIKDGDTYKQLNANILQIENEFYSNIRPKQTGLSGERPTQALRNRGVEYIEVRCLDLNPFEPMGLNKTQIQFLDAFLVFCLLEDDIQTSQTTTTINKKNMDAVVYQGRNSQVKIVDANTEAAVPLKEAANSLLININEVAKVFDKSCGNKNTYQKSVQHQKEKVADPELTASGKIVHTLEKQQLSFYEFTLQQANEQKEYFSKRPLSKEKQMTMQTRAQQSHEKQKQIEADDTIDFDSFVANYFKD